MKRRLVAAAIVALSLLTLSRVHLPASIDREGYWRNPSLLDIFAPPVESAYRASIVKSITNISTAITDTNSTATQTVTAVSTGNSVLIWDAALSDTASDDSVAYGFLALTNTTTVTGTRIGTAGALTINGALIEYYPNYISSKQDFNIALANGGAASGTATISSVSLTKTALYTRGSKTDATTNAADQPRQGYTQVLTNATTVTATRSFTGGNLTVYGTAVQFK